MKMMSLLHDGEEEHGPLLFIFLNWYENSNLRLNISKTKNIVNFIEKEQRVICSILINGEQMQLETTYKYRGIILDNKLGLGCMDWLSKCKQASTKNVLLKYITVF